MKQFTSFLYNFLFVDQAKNRMSHTKFLSIAGGLVMIAMFPYAVIHGSAIEYEMWLVFAVCFLGNRTINKIAEIKMKGKPYGQDATEKE